MPVITHEKLKELLRKGPTRFHFIKTNGSPREAFGTTNLGEIPEGSKPRGGNPPEGTTPFFDLAISEWRTVSHTSEIRID